MRARSSPLGIGVMTRVKRRRAVGGLIVVIVIAAAVGVGWAVERNRNHPALPPASVSSAGKATVRVTRGNMEEVVSLGGAVVSSPTFSVVAVNVGAVEASSLLSAGVTVAAGSVLFYDGGTAVVAPVAGTIVGWFVTNGVAPAKNTPVVEMTYNGFGMSATLLPETAYRILSGRVTGKADIDNGPGPFPCPILQTPAASSAPTASAVPPTTTTTTTTTTPPAKTPSTPPSGSPTTTEPPDQSSATPPTTSTTVPLTTSTSTTLMSSSARKAMARQERRSEDKTATPRSEDSMQLLAATPTTTTPTTTATGPSGTGSTGAPSSAVSGPAIVCAIPTGVTVFSGLVGQVAIISGVASNVLVLPNSAVLGTAENGDVFVVGRKGRATEIQVGLGMTNGGLIQITSGLTDGETVLANPPTLAGFS
jgi:hypothetical protein